MSEPTLDLTEIRSRIATLGLMTDSKLSAKKRRAIGDLLLWTEAFATARDREAEEQRARADQAVADLGALREHTLNSNPALRALHDEAVAHRKAVIAYTEVHGPLSTTLEWVIRHGSLSVRGGEAPDETRPTEPGLAAQARELATHPQPSGEWRVADAQFIATAHWLLPQLADEIDVLNGQVRRSYAEGVAVARKLQGRLDRIAEAHAKYIDELGGTFGDCNECGHTWPCPSHQWATAERNPVIDCWDPIDDEDDRPGPRRAADEEPERG